MNFKEILSKMQEIYDKKSHDYSKPDDRFSNFKYAGDFAADFTDPTAKAFAVIIGIKLARLINLQHTNPLNESVADTWIDLCNYVVLWAEFESQPKVLFPDGCVPRDSTCAPPVDKITLDKIRSDYENNRTRETRKIPDIYKDFYVGEKE